MRKTNHLQIVIFGLQCAAGPYRWAKYAPQNLLGGSQLAGWERSCDCFSAPYLHWPFFLRSSISDTHIEPQGANFSLIGRLVHSAIQAFMSHLAAGAGFGCASAGRDAKPIDSP
jgi:hypothetical protein